MLQELLTDCKMGEKRTEADGKMVRQDLNQRLDAVLPNRQQESGPETGSMRNDLRFLYDQVREAGSENGFGGECAKKQDKRGAVSEEPPKVIHKERKTDKKKKRKLFQIVHPAVLLTSLLMFAVLEICLLLWIFKCDGSRRLLFPYFIWRIVGEQPVEAKKGRKENDTAWHLAGGRG